MKKRWKQNILCLMLLLTVLGGCKKKTENSVPADPMVHTTAMAIELPGCGNLYNVSDALYRGEQPTAEGFQELERLGIKTVVNLRSLHSDGDKLEGARLGYETIPMQAWDPEVEQVEAFLKIVTDPAKQPVFVHCQHGADRTGTMVAVYRIVVEGWEIEKAIDEMRNGPFGFHEIFSGLPEFIEELDVESLRSKYNTNTGPKESPGEI